ncbi:MAG TPA: TonB-dependent receptor [Bryobacterales bacterium]|nr:TonB-dependent receptor [Bryobacterales bacterium]
MFLCAAAAVWAQTERGNITGQVKDPSGAAIPGAEVSAVQTATNVRTVAQSTTAGEYNIPVPPGVYRVTVTAAGFKRYVHDNVTLAAASTVRLDAVLELGTLSESVEVSADVAQIQTETAKVSASVQNRMVDELPLVVGGALRSPFDLVSITPESRGSGGGLALGGGQAAAWDATLDGLSVTTNRSANTVEIAYNAPSLDAITEFTVDTNGFKAEYGQAGGGVMTFSSKSGTNDLHGNAYDFLRNDDLDARGFFAPSRSIYKQNDFGATLGGPVYIPKLYNGKNRTFFFLSYEGFRNRVGANGTILSVPTPEMYQGDFSNWVDTKDKLLQIYDPATTAPNPNGTGSIRTPFANNQVPQSRFAAFSKVLIPYGAVIKPNRPGIVPGDISYVRNNYISNSGTLLSPTDKGSAKVDHIIHDNHRLGFLFNITRFRQEPGADGPPGLPEPLWNGQSSLFNTEIYRFSYDWTVSPRLLNHFSIGGNHFIKDSFSPNIGGNWKNKVCMKNVIDCNANFAETTFTEFQGWGGDGDNGTEQPMWAIKDDLSYSRGKHTLKFGYAFDSQRANGFGQQQIGGAAGYSFLGTSVPGATSFTSGSSFASFLLGWADSGGTETVRYVPQRYAYHGLYVQDDWHVTSRLTLNLGLRYEFTLPPISLTDEYSDFTPDRPNPAVNNYPGALRFAGFGPGRENTRSLVPGWYGGIGPRVGAAFAADSKTTFRTAFGRSFSKVTVVSGSGHYAGFIGLYRFNSANQDVTPAFLVDNGLPPYPLPPQINPAFANNQSVDYWQPQDAARAPENLYWTFSAQRQVTPNTVLEAVYDANVGTHLQTGLVNINQTPTAYLNQFIQQYGAAAALSLLRSDINSPAARAAGIPIPYANFTDPSVQQFRTVNQALRPFPQYQTVTTGGQGGDKSGHSTYHALTLKAERRFSSGLTFQWNYVFSKLLTDSDNYSTGSAAQDQYNRRLEKSIGQYDQTHSLKLNTLYDLPVGRGKRFLSQGLASRVLGGWRIGAIQSYASGFPIALARNNPFPIFNGPTRPIVTSYDNWRAPVAGGKFDPNVDKFLNKAAFPAQPNDQFGNVTRYNPKLRSFPMFNENVSLAKSFSITENKRIDFRWEAFNLFNRTQFGTPSTNLDSNSFGVVSSQANTPRQMQVALKLYW